MATHFHGNQFANQTLELAMPFVSKADHCLLCHESDPKVLDTHLDLPGVTSDCRTWEHPHALVFCRACGHVQKKVDHDWHCQVSAIYESYNLYGVSGGEEQREFIAGIPVASRSAWVLGKYEAKFGLAEKGKLLDVGCGNGSLLRSFCKLRPRWRIYAQDRYNHIKDKLSLHVNVEKFYCGSIEDIEGQFDLVTAFHVIEHIVDLHDFLLQIQKLLKPQGHLLIQVPCWRENPFDLMVVDHVHHFLPASLISAAQTAGFESLFCSMNWRAREISLVLGKTSRFASTDKKKIQSVSSLTEVRSWLEWLRKVSERVMLLRADSLVGVFGTGIAGIWTAASLGGNEGFVFVDEDPARIHKSYLGIPIYHPSQILREQPVFLALPPTMAMSLRERFLREGSGMKWVLPPFSPQQIASFQEVGDERNG